MLYQDKHRHLWCMDCERWNGQVQAPDEQPSMFEARYPGDPLGSSHWS